MTKSTIKTVPKKDVILTVTPQKLMLDAISFLAVIQISMILWLRPDLVDFSAFILGTLRVLSLVFLVLEVISCYPYMRSTKIVEIGNVITTPRHMMIVTMFFGYMVSSSVQSWFYPETLNFAYFPIAFAQGLDLVLVAMGFFACFPYLRSKQVIEL
jgi:hypothetical protein